MISFSHFLHFPHFRPFSSKNQGNEEVKESGKNLEEKV